MKIKGTYLPTYEECVKICELNETFYENKHIIDGYNVSTFNYRVSVYDDFNKSYNETNKSNAKELRGLTFVFNHDGSLYRRFLALQKFWNVNQVEETLLSNIKDFEVVEVYNKLDGSLCHFVELPNGKIVAKTQNSFDNPQVSAINKIYDADENIQKFVKWCMDMNYSAIFEYTSFLNRIVIKYGESSLNLLRVRNNETGEYLNIEDLEYTNGLKIVGKEDVKPLEVLLKEIESVVEKEGSVITLKCSGNEYVMVKAKGAWYCNLHHLVESVEREDSIIELFLDDKIDDVLGQISTNENILEFVNNIIKKVKKYTFEKMNSIELLVSKYEGSEKEFALKYLKDQNFGYAMNVIRGRSTTLAETIKDIKMRTKRLELARKFLESIDL